MTIKDFIPREHGAWAMWIVPMLSAALVTRFSWEFFALFVSFALLYSVHHPVVLMLKRKRLSGGRELEQVAALALPALLLGLAPVVFAGRLWLFLFGAAEALFFSFSIKSFLDREQRSFLNELEIVAALALTAPAAYYTITGRLDPDAVLLFMLNLLFFGSSVFYVKMRIEFLKKKGNWIDEAKKAFVLTLSYHLILIAVLAAAAVSRAISPWILLGFVPALGQVIGGMLSKKTRMNFTRLGVSLAVQSAIFLAVTGFFMR